MKQNALLAIALVILVACGLVGGMAVKASLAGSSEPEVSPPIDHYPMGAVVINAGGNPMISYQGVLKEGANPYPNNPATMTFTIYSGGTPGEGGTLEWTEYQDSVEIQGNGYFATLLGSVTTIARDTFESPNPMYLEVKVGNDKMKPYQRLATTPYSFHSYYSGTAAFAGTASYAINAGLLGGNLPNSYMEKSTYDYNPEDNVVDIAAYANNADKLDNQESSAFMIRLNYDSDLDNQVEWADRAEHADTADTATIAGAANSYAPIFSAGETISQYDVVGIDDSGALISGCSSIGDSIDLLSNVDKIDIDTVDDDIVVVAYHVSGEFVGRIRLFQVTDGTWSPIGTEITFSGTAAPTSIEVEYVDMVVSEYVVVSYSASSKGRLWLGEIVGPNIELRHQTWYYWTVNPSIDEMGTTGDLILAYNLQSQPEARMVQIDPVTDELVIKGSIKDNSPLFVMSYINVTSMSDTRFGVFGRRSPDGEGESWMGRVIDSGSEVVDWVESGQWHGGGIAVYPPAVDNFGEDLLILFSDPDEAPNTSGYYGSGIVAERVVTTYTFTDYLGIIMGSIDKPAINITNLASGWRAVLTFTDMAENHMGKMKTIDITAGGQLLLTNEEQSFSTNTTGDKKVTWLDGGNYFAIAYIDEFDNFKGKLILGKSEFVEPVGIAKNSGTTGQDISVAVSGIVENPGWSLVPGTTYYGNLTGGLTTQNTGCKIGRAITSTKIAMGL